MMLTGAKASFCAAHSLPQHVGLHGHSYEVWAYVDNGDAESVQFRLAAACKKLDHSILNEHLNSPTMEGIAKFIADQITVRHPHENVEWRPKKIVVVRPVEGLSAEYTLEN